MELGFIGLGRMGGNMVTRLLAKSTIRVVVHDRAEPSMAALVALGARAAGSPAQLVSLLSGTPRVVWLMLPAGDVTEAVYREVRGALGEGDILIDGANSNHRDTSRRAAECAARSL